MTIFIDEIQNFIEKNLEEFLTHCDDSGEKKKICDSLASFIEKKGMPFNMKDYMMEQSHSIQSYLATLGENCECPDLKQKAISIWLKEEAQNFREQVVKDQAQIVRELDYKIERYLPQHLKEQIKSA